MRIRTGVSVAVRVGAGQPPHAVGISVPDQKAALDNLFVQVLGMLSAEGLITLERVTLDGTKIKANAGGNTFRRKETMEAHLQLAREQVRLMEEQAAAEEQMAQAAGGGAAAGRTRNARAVWKRP